MQVGISLANWWVVSSAVPASIRLSGLIFIEQGTQIEDRLFIVLDRSLLLIRLLTFEFLHWRALTDVLPAFDHLDRSKRHPRVPGHPQHFADLASGERWIGPARVGGTPKRLPPTALKRLAFGDRHRNVQWSH